MSSREIATLCDKEHKHVKRDIDVMTEQLELDTPRFGHIYLDSMNRQQTEYLLHKFMEQTPSGAKHKTFLVATEKSNDDRRRRKSHSYQRIPHHA